jgi:methyl-accepting chemotaxis protein
MESFFMRLEKYIHFRPTAAMTNIIVKIMVEVISILGIVTKEIRQGRTSMTFLIEITRKVDVRAEKLLKKLAGRKAVEDAFRRLDKLTPEEALMAAAETMTVTRDIDDTVKGVDKRLESVDEKVHHIGMKTEGIEDKVEGVDSKVQGVDERVKDVGGRVKDVDNRVKDVDDRVKDVDDRVKDVDDRVKDVDQRVKDADDRVKGVDGKVGSVIQGRLFFPSLASESVHNLYSVRCKGDWNGDPTGGQSGQQPKS